MLFVMLSAVTLIFVQMQILLAAAAVAVLCYLLLAWPQFTIGTWVPVLLSALALVVALWRGTGAEVLWQAADRMVFLAALIAMLGTLRSAAAIAPEVAQAGQFVTSQPASRRYLAMTFGGHLFGVLINFGGLALLLDIAKTSATGPARMDLPPDAQEARLKRMSLAVIRGFSMISLWSPFGFATNAILITIPGIAYTDFGPLGFAMTFIFIAIGWAFDRGEGRVFLGMRLPRQSPPPGSWIGAAMLVGHVAALGMSVFLLHDLGGISFQQALIIAVPAYSAIWAIAVSRRVSGAAGGGLIRAGQISWRRLSDLGPEVGVFASAGFLPVTLLALIPAEDLRALILTLDLSPIALAIGLCVSVVGFGLIGVNPIVVSSVLGAIAAQLAVPGLSNAAIALAITGGWTAVIGLSPFITTLTIGSAILGRSPVRIGLIWNGPYCLVILIVWVVLLSSLMLGGVI